MPRACPDWTYRRATVLASFAAPHKRGRLAAKEAIWRSKAQGRGNGKSQGAAGGAGGVAGGAAVALAKALGVRPAAPADERSEGGRTGSHAHSVVIRMTLKTRKNTGNSVQSAATNRPHAAGSETGSETAAGGVVMRIRSGWLKGAREILMQPSVSFGAAMIALLWAGAWLLISTERQAAHNAVAQDTANLARAFEENVVRTIHEIDRMLLYIRQGQSDGMNGAAWAERIGQAFAQGDTTLQVAVIDAGGWLVATDRGGEPERAMNLADRAHFQVHASADEDFLHVSKPVLGRASGRWSVQMTRRLVDAEGRFAGVLVASFDPTHFARFYESVSIGTGSAAMIAGLDGVVRAGGGGGLGSLGAPIADALLLARLRRHEEATVHLAAAGGLPERIASFRRVRGHPLAVVVAADAVQPDSSWQRHRPIWISGSIGLTAIIVLAVLGGLRRSRRLAETRAELKEKSRQLEVTLDNIAQGIVMVDDSGRIGVLNRRCAEMLALPPALAAGRGTTYDDLVRHLEAAGEFERQTDAALLAHIRSHRDGALLPVWERTRPDGTVLEIRNKALPGGGFVRTLSDVTERRRAEAKIVHLARHDPLTGVANRALFRQKLDEACAEIGEGRPFGLLLIDLDHFKGVNDTWGHLVGDKLLSEVADRLRGIVRAGDLVARLGGDEFAIIAHSVTQASHVVALAERVCRAARQPFVIDGNVLLIGASVGIALAPADGTRAQELLHAADLAMYAVKAEGRGTYKLFSRALDAEQKARRALEADLRTAIVERQFELHYQPIKSIGSNAVTAYEALIRWRHPERGMVPPLDFIPLAEETGLIVPMGAWVLETACRDMARSSSEARVAVNLSPLQFRDKNLLGTISAALERSGLAAHRLEIEITESALLYNDQLTQAHLTSLRRLGVHITMDDFGTGYSSLGYLMSYPIQSIKIDRSFVAGLGEKASSMAIVRAITTLATSLGLSTTAEGVETERQLSVLRELGCTDAQGYLFSRPMPGEAILPSALASGRGASAA